MKPPRFQRDRWCRLIDAKELTALIKIADGNDVMTKLITPVQEPAALTRTYLGL
jgi:hypothetical protein